MSEGQDASGPAAPDPPEAEGSARGPRADAASLLLAVERVQDDLRALSRAVAASPEQVAARLDVDAATAAVGVRVGALGSTLDQLRLSLLTALDRAIERFEAPPWMPEILAVLVGLGRRFDSPVWLPDLQAAMTDLASTGAERDELRQAVGGPPAAVGDTSRMLGAVLARVEQQERTIGERLDWIGDRLADDVRASAAVGEAVGHLGDRLEAVEAAAGQMAEEARLLVDQVAPVPERLVALAGKVDRISGEQTDAQEQRTDEGPLEVIVEVLAGVTRRQDEVTAALTSVLDQARNSKGVEAVFERAEERERSLAARLDRIDAELRRPGRPEDPDAGTPDAETARAVDAVAASVEQQERALAARLDQIDLELRRLGEATATATAPPPEPDDDVRRTLDAVLDRLEQQERAVAAQLDEVSDRLTEVAAHLVSGQEAADAGRGEEDRTAAAAALLERMSRRQDDLAAALSSLVDQMRGPTAVEAVFDRMEQRERSLAARLDRIDLELRRRSSVDPEPAAGMSDLARLVESVAERLDRRLSGVEATLEEAARRPAPPPAPARPSASTEAAALRLAELRAERAQVQARLQEERLLAAEAWDDA